MTPAEKARALLDTHHGLGASKRELGAHIVAYERVVPALLDAIEAQRAAGGCARDQRTTQFCAEAVAKDAEIARLRSGLAAAHPVVEWRRMLDGRTGEVTTHVAEVGVAALRVTEKQWRARSFPGWKGEKPGWAVVFGMKYVAASGPETGPAGKSACEAAYRRACGLSAP